MLLPLLVSALPFASSGERSAEKPRSESEARLSSASPRLRVR